MGAAPRPHHAGAAVALVLAFSPALAGADPLHLAPATSKLRWGDPEDAAVLDVVGGMRALGVGNARRLATWPDRAVGIETQEPQLVALQLGLVARLRCAPLTFVLRGDLAEPVRPLGLGGAGAAVGALVDDAYVQLAPWRPLSFVIGRARVPWSKTRQWDDLDEPIGAPPFLVDRIAPDRRWGLTLLGDLGSGSYAAGVYEDLDELEPRPIPADVSTGGRVAAFAHVEWTPIAPMYGSNPPGRVSGARGPLPTPRGDPWYRTPRLSLGLGAMYRLLEDESRIDVSLSAHLKWRWTSLVAEMIATPGDLGTDVAAHAAISLTPLDRLAVTGRLEWDPGASEGGQWVAAGALTWHVTRDRLNKLALVSWLRRDDTRDTALDAVVVLVQASL